MAWGSRYKFPKPAARDIVQRMVSKVWVQVWHDWKEKPEFYFSLRLPEGSFLFPSGKLAMEDNNRNRSSSEAISGCFFPISGDCEENVGWELDAQCEMFAIIIFTIPYRSRPLLAIKKTLMIMFLFIGQAV